MTSKRLGDAVSGSRPFLAPCKASIRSSDNQPLDSTTFVREVQAKNDRELRLYLGQGISPTLIIYGTHLTLQQ